MLRGITYLQKIVFRVLTMVLWLAPIGAFGAMAAVVGESGAKAVGEMLKLMFGFYVTCALFIFVILGALLWLVARVNIFKLLKYLAREFLLIVATSSSESALPNLMAKMEHAGVDRSTVGIVVPTGYSFNLDGTAIYLTMASLFIADAMNMPMSMGEQIGLLLFMIVASKGAAGVTGAGLATLAGGLHAHKPELVDGVGVHRRYRPLHVRGSRADELRGQLRRHGSRRHVDQVHRPRAPQHRPGRQGAVRLLDDGRSRQQGFSASLIGSPRFRCDPVTREGWRDRIVMEPICAPRVSTTWATPHRP